MNKLEGEIGKNQQWIGQIRKKVGIKTRPEIKGNKGHVKKRLDRRIMSSKQLTLTLSSDRTVF